MNNNNIVFIGILILGLMLGFIFGSFSASVYISQIKKPFDDAIVLCQKNLPRDQTCYIEYAAKVKK